MKIKHTTNYVVPKSSEELRFKEKTSPADDTDDDYDQSIWRNNADAGMIGVLDWAKGNDKYFTTSLKSGYRRSKQFRIMRDSQDKFNYPW